MPWKHDGKIAMQFNWGAVNYDAVKIVYADNSHPYTADGDETNAINKVYYFPDGFNPATLTDSNLDDYLFWHRYWEEPPSELQLVRGTTGVLIEYSPSANMTLNSFGIFEDNGDTTKTNDNFRIFNEGGIQIAFLGTGTIISNEVEKYGLTGHIRTGNMGSVPLQADKKYYFLFQTDSNQSSNAIPAMFYDEVGVTRQTYTAQSDSETTTADVSTWNNYITGNTSTDLINNFLAANQNDYMTWTYNNTYSFVQNKIYLRSNNPCPTGNFIGSVGGLSNNDYYRILETNPNDLFVWNGNNGMGVNNSTIYQTTNELSGTTSLGSLTADSEVIAADANTVFIFNGNSQAGLNQSKIYKKLVGAISSYSTSQNSEGYKLAEMFMKNSTPGNTLIPLHTIYYQGQNKIWDRKDVGSVQISTMTPQDDWSTLSSTVVNNGIYFLKQGATFPGINLWENSVAQYIDGNFYKIDENNNNAHNISAYYNILNLNNPIITTEYSTFTDTGKEIVTTVGSIQSMYSTTAQPQEAFLNTTFNDARYYLEINGNEVDTSKKE